MGAPHVQLRGLRVGYGGALEDVPGSQCARDPRQVGASFPRLNIWSVSFVPLLFEPSNVCIPRLRFLEEVAEGTV